MDLGPHSKASLVLGAGGGVGTATFPLGGYGAVEEYADAMAFLASRRAAPVTGSAIRLEGGMIQGSTDQDSR